MENQFNEQQSLQIIQRMIENSKARFSDNSFFFILWGWLVLFTSVLDFVLLQIKFYRHFLVWPVFMSIGLIISIIESVRISRKAKAKTVYSNVMTYLWSGYTVCIILIVLILNISNLSPHFIPIFILMLSGLATLVTGATIDFSALKIGGFSCWILVVIALFSSPEYTVLFSGFSMITAYLIPGYMLKYKVKRNV